MLVASGRNLPLRSHVADRLPRLGTGKVNVPALLIGSVVLLGLLLFTAFDESWAQATYISLAAGVMVLSIVVLTSCAGRLSLAQWALEASGAVRRVGSCRSRPPHRARHPRRCGAHRADRRPLRPTRAADRGVNLAVVTLGLGFTVSEVVFANNQYIGSALEGGTRIGRVKLFGIEVGDFDHPHRWALVSLVAFVGIGLVVANLRRSPDGPPAHRRAHQRAGRGFPRHQRGGREALRLRGGGGHR